MTTEPSPSSAEFSAEPAAGPEEPAAPEQVLDLEAARTTGHELAALTRVVFGLAGLAHPHTTHPAPAAAPADERPPAATTGPVPVELPETTAPTPPAPAPTAPAPDRVPPAGLPVPTAIPLPDHPQPAAPAADAPPAPAAAGSAPAALPLPDVPVTTGRAEEPEERDEPAAEPRRDQRTSGRQSMELLQEIAFLDE